MSVESVVNMEYVDLLNVDNSKIDLYENNGVSLGYVELIDIMPRIIKKGQTGDVAVVDGARMSYKQKPGKFEPKTEAENKGLIDYLVEHYHTSPLELAEVKFMVCAPLFVFNQLVRHRTANLNVISRRYTEIEEENTYIPELRYQDDINKQGSKSSAESNEYVEQLYKTMYDKTDEVRTYYKSCVDNGVGKEVARCAMPQNVMTEFVWKIDLHNFLKMVRLRIHHTAQKEIRELANAMYELVKPKFPYVCMSFEKYWLNSMSLTDEEIVMLGKMNKGEQVEFKSKRKQQYFNEKIEKLKKLGLIN